MNKIYQSISLQAMWCHFKNNFEAQVKFLLQIWKKMQSHKSAEQLHRKQISTNEVISDKTGGCLVCSNHTLVEFAFLWDMGQAKSKVRTLNLDRELAGWPHPVRRKQCLSDQVENDEWCLHRWHRQWDQMNPRVFWWCCSPENIQCLAEWGFEHPYLAEDITVLCRGLD